MDPKKYPIGYYRPPEIITGEQITTWIQEIAEFPDQLEAVVASLPMDALDLRYRPEGWTIRQVVYHLGDSHLNSYVRFMWTLTEDSPLIKAYGEASWAEVHSSNSSIQAPLQFLNALHVRWVELLDGIEGDQWDRIFKHPENGREVSLKKNLGLYAWHGKHHLAHIHMALES
jgi:hypothetical protein